MAATEQTVQMRAELLRELAASLRDQYRNRFELAGVRTELVNDLVASLDSVATGSAPATSAALTTANSTVADKFAEITKTKHIARVLNSANPLNAFCPKCGRHYRHHDKTTGDCPAIPAFKEDKAAVGYHE